MTSPPAGTPTSPTARRRKRLVGVAVLLTLAGAGWGAWTILHDPAVRSTDDAYVAGHVVQVTPEVAGTVIRILADNTNDVAAGTLLVELDPTDAKIALATAEAQLAQSVRNVRGQLANNAHYDAEVQLRQAELTKAEADFKSRAAIVNTGAISRETFRHAGDAVSTARAALASAEQMRAQALAQTIGSTVDNNPAVRLAAENVRAAALALARSRIPAPVSGMVAQRNVQLGRRVAPGEVLMSIVPLDELWVDANFKEVQLEGICPGQPASVTADIYGSSVVYHGHVVGIAAGTGSAFALLPAQNATGNWIKVVQRAPVRLSLDPAELAKNPLRIGMSVEAEVDAHACISPAPGAGPTAEDASPFYGAQARQADANVARIIAENIEARQ